MKRLLAALAFILLSAPAVGAEPKTDRQKDGLVGLVRTVRVEAARFSNQAGRWIEEPRELAVITTYDGRGNKLEMVPGQTDIKGLFEGIRWEKQTYTYDDQGRLAEVVSYNSNGSLIGKMIHTYDDKGKLTKIISYSSDGSPGSKTVYTYDDKGHLTAETSSDAAGFMGETGYTYDDKGNLIEETIYGPGLNIKGRAVHTYDAQGHRISTTTHDTHDGALGIDKVVTTYDAKGNILEETTHYTEKVGMEDRPVLPPAKWVYTYELDAQGNWIKQTRTDCSSESGEPVCEPSLVTYRTITYYPEAAAR